MKRRNVAITTALVVGGVGALVAVLSASSGDRGFAVRAAALIELGGQDRLLVISRNGWRGGTVDRGRISIMDLQGRVLKELTERRGAIRLLAVEKDLLWLHDLERGLHARALPDLSLVPGIVEAQRANPMIATGALLLGMHPEGVALKGRDDRFYVVTEGARILEKGRKLDYQRFPSHFQERDNTELGISAARVEGRRVSLRGLELLQPKVMGDRFTLEPLTLNAPRSVLVRSIDFKGAGNSHILSRVTIDGEVRWSVKLRDLMKDTRLGAKTGFGLRSLDVKGDALIAIIEASNAHRSGSSRYGPTYYYDARVLILDAGTGEPRSISPITRPGDAQG